MDAIAHFTQSSIKKSVPELRPGDTVRVHQRIREGNKERIQIFEGVVIAVRGGKSINSSYVVRRIASGVGVEKTFPLHSPNVVKVERLKSGKVRQARLFYLRERFGRTARLAGEIRNSEDWHEGKFDSEEASNVEDNQEVTADEVTDNESTNDVEPVEAESVSEELATPVEDMKMDSTGELVDDPAKEETQE